MDRSLADHLELEIGTVRIPFKLLTLLTHLASEASHGDRTPEVVSSTLALLYPQLNRIEEGAILARGMDPWGRADFEVELVEGFREVHL